MEYSKLPDVTIETEETNYIALLVSVLVFGGLSYVYYKAKISEQTEITVYN